MKNKSGIKPTEYKVLVLAEKAEEKTSGGIIIPDAIKDRNQSAATKGEIIDISPLAFKFDDWADSKCIPKAGDKVAFARYSGVTIDGADDVEYRLVNDKDIIAILD